VECILSSLKEELEMLQDENEPDEQHGVVFRDNVRQPVKESSD